MGLCEDIQKGYSVGCSITQRLFAQKIVLINKSDVLDYLVKKTTLTVNGEYVCNHNIVFRLKENASGKQISNISNASNIFGTSERALNDFISEYTHSVSFVAEGYTENLICFLENLNTAYYFAALMLNDNSVIIYGFGNGLRSSSYSIDVQGNGSITNVKLETGKDEEEADMPYIYKSTSSTPKNDFENLFSNIPNFRVGDFNSDFNNDYFK